MFLVPGDSPAGLRLPLDSLPALEPDEIPVHSSPATRPNPSPRSRRTPHSRARPRRSATSTSKPEPGHVRTAMTFEARGGILHVFMPPTGPVEDYLELVAHVEAVAAARRSPSASKATPRPTIRASACSRSPPIPA